MNFGEKEFTLLSDEQTFGSRKIDVIERLGGQCAISDFAILLGAYVDSDYHVDGDSSLKGRKGWWYLSSSDGDGGVRTVHMGDAREWTYAGKRSGGVRPALPFSNISDISPNGVRGRSGFVEVEYGEYPQYVVDTSLGRTLDSEFSAGRLRKTGKTYTTDSRRWNDYSEKFSPVEHEEFEYNGKRYVRVKSNCSKDHKLTNGVTAHPGDYFWVEVSPIVWYVDEKSKMLVSKTLLASGIRFCENGQYRDDLKRTEMYMYLNKHFAKDMVTISMIEKKEQDIYSELTIEDKDFIITAAKIRNFLLSSESAKNINSRYDEKELVPLSVLLAILWSEIPKGNAISEFQRLLIENITLDLGVDVDACKEYLNKNHPEDTYIIYQIERYYTRYYTYSSYDYTGVNTVILSLISQVFNHNITNTNTISKILNDFNISIEQIKSLIKIAANTPDKQIPQSVNLNKLNTKTKDFIEFAGKIYILLRQNEKLLALYNNDENELYELAIFIATYYKNDILREYIEFKGYSLDTLLKPLDITISEENIKGVNFDYESMQTFTKEKVLTRSNYYQSIAYLKIDDIVKPIETTACLHNGILGEILKPLNTSSETNIFIDSKDHKEQTEREEKARQEKETVERKRQEEQQEKQRKDQLIQEILGDCSDAVYNYMKVVALAHKIIVEEHPEMDIEQVKTLALLVAAKQPSLKIDKNAESFLQFLGITLDNSEILKKCWYYAFDNIRSKDNDTDIDIDIDIIQEHYQDYLFKGYNNGCDKQDITPFSIMKNIFSNQNSSIKTKVFLNKLSSKNLTNIDPIEEWKKIKAQEQEKKEQENRVKHFKRKIGDLEKPDYNKAQKVYHLSMIYEVYKYLESNNVNGHNQEQLFQLAIIISSFFAPDNGKTKETLIRNGIKLEDILLKYGLDHNKIEQQAEIEPLSVEIGDGEYKTILLHNYARDEILYDISPKYLNAAKNYTPEREESFKEVIATILNEKENIIEVLLQDEEQYNRLKTEITTGKTYEETLPIEDKIAILNQTPIERVDTSSVESILQFGKSLQNASKLMQSELMEALKKDTIDEATASILEVTNSMVPKSPQRGFIKIFRRQDSQGLPNISQESIDVLSNKIEKILDDLKKELSLYTQLRSYHVIHSKKIEEHYQALLIEKARLEAELTKQKENNNVIEESQLKTLLDIVMHKLHNFVVSKGIDSQEIARIDLAIATHARTIITLELAQNSIFPLIASEYIISDGVDTERNASTTVRGLIGLFNSLLTQNLKSAAENMQLLPSSPSIGNGQIGIISETAANIIQQLEDGTQKTKK